MSWISVKDQLPKENGTYIIAIDLEKIDKGSCNKVCSLRVMDDGHRYYKDDGHRYYKHDIKIWTVGFVQDKFDCIKEIRENITHWMPFPEFPDKDK